MKVESKPKELVRPKGQAERLSDIYSPDLTLTPETFQHLLASHGVVIDEKNKLLTIKSSSVNKDCQYSLTDEEVKKLMAETKEIVGTSSQSPTSLGKETIKVAYKMLHHKKYKRSIIVPTKLITKENIEEYDITGWQ